MGVSILRAVVPAEAGGWRLDKALAAALPEFSRERLKGLISGGQVHRADGAPADDPSAKVASGSAFDVSVPPPAPLENEAQDIPLDILYEDADLFIINKPAGLVVHPGAGNPDGTLVNALLHHCSGQLSGIGGVARPGIVHRIDKETSGLLVVAKSDTAHEGLARQFKDHSIARRYLAIASGHPRPMSGTIETWIGRSERDRKKMAVQQEGRGKHAITHYRTLETLKGAALMECRLETGRTHQVRVHMAHIGHALIGDPAYGRAYSQAGRMKAGDGGAKNNFRRQALHAAALGFIHPITEEKLVFESALPADMQELLSQLRV